MIKCQHCYKSLIKSASNKIKLRNKGVLAFSLTKGRVVCEMVCPYCGQDTVVPLSFDDSVLTEVSKSLAPSPVTFYIRPPSARK